MKRNPEFVLMMVMLTTKPLPLLVALRDMSTKRLLVHDELCRCNAGKVVIAVSTSFIIHL